MNICESVAPSISSELTTKLEVCPWSLRRFGLVSLLDMLRYAAEDFVEITRLFASLEIDAQTLLNPEARRDFQNCLDKLSEHALKLEMPLTQNQIETVVEVINRWDFDAISREIDQLLRRIQEELKARSFRYVDKPGYELGFWILNRKAIRGNRDVLVEMQSAGRCYAYGEHTACVFHLMRVIDYGLRLVAASLGIAYDARSWDGIGKAIEKKMREKYGDKTDDWKASEPFYAEILTDIQAIGRGHRNPALHELEKKYDEHETEYLLPVAVAFIEHVLTHTAAGNLQGA
jgi:hypothetical protein